MVGAAVVVTATAAQAETKSLSFYNAHTRERATFTFKRDGRYDQAQLAKLNHFMRDWRKNKPTKMDPELWDLIYEVYKETGASRPITVICGYRSPETNSMLRSRSNGVAQNSLHTRGQALDFYIPGVDLAKLRAIGLRMQAGGVGFYPGSGSPFVHMDTGSVRHWPRMSRSQLVKVFPNGNTLHVPTDGKPLPGYAQALASYKARKARGIVVAQGAGGGDYSSVAVAAEDVPLPRSAPTRPEVIDTLSVAMAERFMSGEGADEIDDDSLLSYPPTAGQNIDSRRFAERFVSATGAVPAPREVEDELDPVIAAFDRTYENTAQKPAPTDLVAAMVLREQTTADAERAASRPIQPTAVVDTVNLSRPFRADAITTAVLRGNEGTGQAEAPPVMAYASAGGGSYEVARTEQAATPFGVPNPQENPSRTDTAGLAPAAPAASAPDGVAPRAFFPAQLTLTKLDTQSLRWWIATPSTREKRYALLTVPDYSGIPTLLELPEAPAASQFAPIEGGVQRHTFRFEPTERLPQPSVAVAESRVILQQQ